MSLITDATNIATNRRSFLRSTLAASAGAALLPAAFSQTAGAAVSADLASSDLKVLNFALQLEYLEAQYYSLATTGMTLEQLGFGTDGFGTQGTVTYKTSSTLVPFESSTIKGAALEIAQDEQNHVTYLRGAIAAAGATPAAQPPIDLVNSFNTLGTLIGMDSFDPFETELTFLLGAFIFEDVGVTAYRGGSGKISNPAYLKAAAGILAVEAFHAGEIRALLFTEGFQAQCQAISDVRDSVDGSGDLDQGIADSNGNANFVPTDANGLVFSRNARRVLDIVYGAKNATSGLFFPSGINM